MRRVVWIAVWIAVFLFVLPHIPVRADGEFRADYAVEYDVADSSVAHVTQTVTLTNLQTNIYPKQYSIILDTDRIRDIRAQDPSGQIIPSVTTTGDKTQILLTFNSQVVGLGKHLTFTLQYENLDVAQKKGTIWEVNIPGIADTKDLGTYTVTLQTPSVWGAAAYMKPPPAGDGKWTKSQMIAGGISAAYGTNQFFTLNLKYYLDNPDQSPKKTEIALPPDTAFQKVSILSINPQPGNVIRDADGNWLAQYTVKGTSTLEIDAKVTVAINLTPRPDFSRDVITDAQYLRPTRYWQSDNQQIIELARKYRTPQAIYDYVVHTLSYDYDRVSQNPVRKGAVAALQQPQQSVCMEFTDLFVAIARAAGIPARQAIGYAYTTNTKLRPLSLVTDVLHAWPEYYDETRHLWIPVDPTWANTTGGIDYFTQLDFNHIVFAVNGIQDDYPYPAGSYRQNGKNGKILDIQFADDATKSLRPATLNVSVNFPDVIAAGLIANGSITIRNDSGTAADDVTVTIRSIPENTRVTRTVSHIPPYTDTKIPFSFSSGTFFYSGNGSISATVGGKETVHDFQIRPFHVIIGGIGIVSMLGAVLLWIVLGKSQKKNLNWFGK